MALTAGTLNSVSISGTTATLNVTPAVDAAYSFTQPLYKIKGVSAWSLGATYAGSQGVAGNTNITGLEEDRLYEFCVLTADSSSRYSLASSILQKQSTTTSSENNLFIANAITLLSNSTEFISFIGGTTSSDALLRIHNKELSELNPNKKIYFPCACVYFDSDESKRFDSHLFIRNINIKYSFYKEVPAEKDRDEPVLATAFMNTIGKIIAELQLLQGIDTYLVVKTFTLDNEPMFGGLTQIDEDQETKTDLINISMTLQAGH